ncbi:MAG: TIGR03088 family PEP-CTERM/XrtA system glycosyltransferase, partial [Steroidobacteraceae bacterium]
MSGSPPLIAHVIHRLDFGGLENGLVNLVNRLPAERYRHAIVCLAGFNPVFRQRIQRDDVEVISLDKRPGKDVGAYGRMWRVLRRLRPAIVHTRNLGTVDMQWVAAAARVPHRIHGEHGWEASDPQGLDPRSLRIRRACRPVIHRYVPMSRDLARWLEQDVGVPHDRIRQLYSGVDCDRFYPPSDYPLSAIRYPLVLGTIGRLDPVKNQTSLLEAFATLGSERGDLRLTIVGDGPLRGTLESRAASLGIAEWVTFTGARNDTPDLLRSFDVFVLPSINEGISNTILEAMATGLPVVAGRVGGNPELVEDGVTGRLYDPVVPDALEHALLPYLADPSLRRAHGTAARARVVQNFSLDAMV